MTSLLAVLIYPSLDETCLARIQSIRRQYDPQFGLVSPHFTLVFPAAVSLPDVRALVESAATAAASFDVELTSVRAIRNPVGIGGHVCLVAGPGASQIVELHTRLYAGPLASARRHDIPYLPHITIAAFAGFTRAELLARQLEDSVVPMTAGVDALTVVDVGRQSVRPIATLTLGPKTRRD